MQAENVPQESRPLFSVIVPFYNEQRWLGQCIHALQRQSLDRSLFELIFVDNASTDRSADIVRSHPGLILLHEPRRDPYLARNRGLEAARGLYIAFLDADCMASPDWLAELRDEIRRSECAIVLGYLANPASASALVRAYEDYYDAKLAHIIEREMSPNYFGHAGNMAIRADVFSTLGPFQSMPIVGDTEIIHRLLKHQPDKLIAYADRAKVVHAEVETLQVCLTKAYECGGYSEACSRVGAYRPLSLPEKFAILLRCIERRNYGALQTLTAVGALALGLGWYAAGRFAHRAQRAKQSKNTNLATA